MFQIVFLEPETYDLDSGRQPISIAISRWAGRRVRIAFRWNVPESYSGPAFFQLDNVRVADSPECIDRALPPSSGVSDDDEVLNDELTSQCLADGGRYYLFQVAPRTGSVDVWLRTEARSRAWFPSGAVESPAPSTS